jgi:glycolate oxidase FAD binding subunit
MTGSLGTLGVISELTLKVRPVPESSGLVLAPAADAGTLARLLDALNTSDTRPAAIEVLNAPALQALGHDVPPAPPGGWTLAVGYEDNAAAVSWQLDRLAAEMGGHVVHYRDAAAAPLWDRLADLPAEPGSGRLSFLAHLRLSGVAGFLARLTPDLWTVQAHAGSGEVHAHAAPGASRDLLLSSVQSLRDSIALEHGSLVLTRCPADWKPAFGVWGPPRADWPLMQEVKAAFDPGAVLNPGRFVGTI